jgi:hypothetical protein
MRTWRRTCSFPGGVSLRHNKTKRKATNLCKVFTRSRLYSSIGRVQKRTGGPSLAGSLTEEFARHMLGIYPGQRIYPSQNAAAASKTHSSYSNSADCEPSQRARPRRPMDCGHGRYRCRYRCRWQQRHYCAFSSRWALADADKLVGHLKKKQTRTGWQCLRLGGAAEELERGPGTLLFFCSVFFFVVGSGWSRR